MFRSPSLHAAICALSLIGLGACGNSAGGGGGVKFVGAPAGSACDTTYHNEGCLAGAAPVKTVKCVDNAGTKTWQDKGACGANQYCVEESDPGDPQGIKKLAICKDVPAAQTGVDAVVAGDATSATDGTATTGDGGTTTDAGPVKTPAEQYACIEQKCPTQAGACAVNAKCAGLIACAKACADKDCRSKCGEAIGEDQTVFALFLAIDACGKAQKCIPSEPAGPVCGDGKCDGGESTETCAKDCKTTGPQCGNGQCEEGESTTTCPADCKPDGPKCGNEKCESGESYTNCPTDCQCKESAECGSGKVCNDGICMTQATTKCGNFSCESGETKASCPLDCDAEAKAAIQCVEKNCGSDWAKCKGSASCVDALICMTKCDSESCVTACAQKAPNDLSTLIAVGTCAQSKCETSTTGPKCGDGKCESPETTSSCPADCKPTGGCTSSSDCKSGEVCTAGQCVAGTSDPNRTCKIMGCVFKDDKGCNCDDQCTQFNDCCPDFAANCAKP